MSRLPYDFQTIFDRFPTGVFILDPQGRYLYMNDAYCRTVGKPKAFFEQNPIPTLTQKGYLTTNVWSQIMEQKRTVVAVVTITDRDLNKVYDTLTIGVPYFDAQGEISCIVYTQQVLSDLTDTIQRGMRNKHLLRDDTLRLDRPGETLLAESPQMKQIVGMLDAVADTDVPILVTGPSGSGKEVLARYIHHAGKRSKGPLVAINCAAIPETLLESELFGYEKGAFTGASRGGKPGLIESASGGTLFLDEINSMPLPVQTKLLRVLETRQVMRLGAVRGREIDFRLVCASNEDLSGLVAEKRFRQDLFYRINVVSVAIPPLSERREDILPLALHFLNVYCKKYGRVKMLSEGVIDRLQRADWPGNVRELRNVIERAVVMSSGSELEITQLPTDAALPEAPRGGQDARADAPDIHDPKVSLRDYLDAEEKALLQRLIAEGQSPAAMAQTLGVDLSSVYRKLKKYGLEPAG